MNPKGRRVIHNKKGIPELTTRGLHNQKAFRQVSKDV